MSASRARAIDTAISDKEKGLNTCAVLLIVSKVRSSNAKREFNWYAKFERENLCDAL